MELNIETEKETLKEIEDTIETKEIEETENIVQTGGQIEEEIVPKETSLENNNLNEQSEKEVMFDNSIPLDIEEKIPVSIELEEIPMQEIVEKEIIVPDFSIYDFNELLRIPNEEYMGLKREVSLFFSKRKDRRFFIYPFQSNRILTANEFIFKIKPIIQFIVIRNMNLSITERLKEILNRINHYEINRLVYQIYSSGVYGRDILKYKLDQLMLKEEEKVRLSIIFFFNLQPVRERPIPQSTVGLSMSEFEELSEEV